MARRLKADSGGICMGTAGAADRSSSSSSSASGPGWAGWMVGGAAAAAASSSPSSTTHSFISFSGNVPRPDPRTSPSKLFTGDLPPNDLLYRAIERNPRVPEAPSHLLAEEGILLLQVLGQGLDLLNCVLEVDVRHPQSTS
eukprot:CAMPEP_0206609022 /NCGR_PEP_ID=MMETSP0325_2-20121206/53458_1 /ASSEMBLY_ACC=CAM_ASM_000347 /TAXON_ID=2866 /ORGANISM="Crypthecodinium cohnii, Strain Seligo" /LENGTH=140 /DNA_ID=CAMNT_0054127067 /DNA_START=430 /DNA_END=854 /DNA_ORIENTATION=-